MKTKILYIEWDDHCSSKNYWNPGDWYRERNRGMPCVSVGVVVAESKDAITLAGTWGDYERESDRDYKCDQTILKSCIKKRRRLVFNRG